MNRMDFVHLRTHTEYSVVDGTLRIADAVRSARSDGQPALAITDLGNLFGAVKFYKACRSEGVKPIIGVDLWMEPAAGSGERAGVALAGAGVQCHRLPQPVRAAVAGLDAERAACAGLGQVGVAGRACGRGCWPCPAPTSAWSARRCSPATGARALAWARRLATLFPDRFYIELQRAGLPTNEAHVRLRSESGGGAQAAGGGHASGAVLRRRRLRRPRGARVRGRRRNAGQPASRQAFFARAVLQDAAADGRAVCRRAVGAGQYAAHRPALQPATEPGCAEAARLPDAGRQPARGLLPCLELRRPRAAPAGAVPRCGEARRAAAAVRAAPGLRDRDDPEDGLRRLLPDRGRLHQLGPAQRLPGGPRPRLGRRLAGGVLAGHHRPRPAALPAAVRALPQPRAGVDAGLRHRFLPGQPRARDRLREGALRPRCGEPDRHLRHDGGQGGAARRGPRAGHGLRPCRFDRQADPGAAGQDGHAGQGARSRPTRA